VTLVQALVWNVEPVAPMLRETSKWKPHEDQSTKAEHRGGVVRSSDEGAVMALERRRNTVQLYREVNRASGGAFG
jgi:hypothetical protein